MSRAASQYLREVRKRIHCSRAQKVEFLCQLEDDVFFYCEDNKYTDYANLTERFGTPADVAAAFMSELDISVVAKTRRVRQYILYLTAAVIIGISILIASVHIYTDYKQQQALDGYYIESITYESDLTPDVTGPTYAVKNGSTEVAK